MNIILVYKAKLIEIKDNIKQLKSIDFDCDNYEEILKKIEEETTEKSDEAYQNFANPDYFLQESLNAIYGNAIKRLDILNDQLVKEHEHFYKLTVKSQLLNKKLKNVEVDEISDIITDMQNLLLQMKKTPTINYDENEKLVEKIYKLIYKGIKLELSVKKDSALLEYIKIDTTDISYIVMLIKEDISQIADKDNKKEVERKIQEINQHGFSDIHYLDKDLIVMLTSDEDSILSSKKQDQILEKLDEYNDMQKELKKKERSSKFCDLQVESMQSAINSNKRKRRKRKLAIAVNWGLVAGLIAISSIKLKPAETKEYKTVTTVYDSSTDDISSSIEYLPETEDSITLVEYQPWEKGGFLKTNYKRSIYTYELDNPDIDYDDIRDYLTSNFKEEATTTEKIEKISTKPNHEYEESEYIITKQIQDREDYNLNLNIGTWIICASSFSAFIILCDQFIFLTIMKEGKSLKTLKTIIIEGKQKLLAEKQKALEAKQEVATLYSQASDLKSSIEVEYEELPTTLKENKEIKRKVLALQQNNIEK